MAEALQTGWFDATFPNASDLSSDLMLDPEALAAVAAFRMATGDWSQGFKVLRRGLSAGYPDARAYQQPYTTFVEYALAQHRRALALGQDVQIWAEHLTEVLVLQAYNVRRMDLVLAVIGLMAQSSVHEVKQALQQGPFQGSRIVVWILRITMLKVCMSQNF
ncbi:hypothetical protein ABBQ38_008809 [Trebouxia sp. C0009 RCD-2024]